MKTKQSNQRMNSSTFDAYIGTKSHQSLLWISNVKNQLDNLSNEFEKKYEHLFEIEQPKNDKFFDV